MWTHLDELFAETQIRERQEWSRTWVEAAGRARLVAGRAEEQPVTAAGRLRRRAQRTARLVLGSLAALALTAVFAAAARAVERLDVVYPLDGDALPCDGPEPWPLPPPCEPTFFPLMPHTF